METLYRKVIIKTAQDLPKDGIYFVHSIKSGLITEYLYHNNPNVWMGRIDWYFHPVEQETDYDSINVTFPKGKTTHRGTLESIQPKQEEEEPNPTSWRDFTMTDVEPKQHKTCDGCRMFGDNGCNLDVSICPDCFEQDRWTAKIEQNQTAEEFVKNKLNEKTGQGITVYEHYLAHDTTISIGTAVSWMKEYIHNQQPEISVTEEKIIEVFLKYVKIVNHQKDIKWFINIYGNNIAKELYSLFTSTGEKVTDEKVKNKIKSPCDSCNADPNECKSCGSGSRHNNNADDYYETR